jgi:hypothetical protein
MNRRRLHRSLIAGAVLALVSAAPVAAQEYSCVGWFASTFAQEDAQAFAAEITGQAHSSRPFGWTTVAPFAHIALEDCQGGD